MKNPVKPMCKLLTSLSLSLALSLSALADDTEIFFSDEIQNVKPNVMFVVDVSGSMDAEVPDSGGKSRLEVMQSALRTVLKAAPVNLNVGLMNYGEIGSRNEGHGVKFPASDIAAEAYPIVSSRVPTDSWGNIQWWNSNIPEPPEAMTVRDYLSEITDWYWKDNWYNAAKGRIVTEEDHVGLTPIVEALFEAALYFRGEEVGFGLGEASYWKKWPAHQSTYDGEIVWDSDKCDEINNYSYSDGIDFDNDERPWMRCPSDPANPASPGSYENCKATEKCRTSSSCVEYTKTCSGTYLKDEGGNEFCDGTTRYVCKDNNYVEKTWCSYASCKGGYTSKPKYKTPITQACQSNFIILLSDGKPQYSRSWDETGDRDGTNSPGPTYWRLEDGSFPPLVGKTDSSKKFDKSSCDANPSPSGYRSGTCGPELTRFLAQSDNSDLDGEQPINTYTVGFGLGGEAGATDYLKSLVTTDDPSTPEIEGYFSAEDEVQLAAAFSNILAKISSTTTSFASPGYSVNLKTGMANEESVYIPVFDKSLSPRWNGNLKKFKLGEYNGNSAILGKDGKPAVDEMGVFEEDTADLWSKASNGDGRDVEKGGVAQLIDPNARLAVSDIKCGSYPCKLKSVANRLVPENAADGGKITNELLGLEDNATETQRQNLVNYIRGRVWNDTTKTYDLHPRMGDMLHTEPVVITYNKNYTRTADATTKYNKQVIFAATNEGYMHAFDTTSGQELFAFMPASLLKNIDVQYRNSGVGQHAYGIDGVITTWIDDVDKNGVISASKGDRVYLYFGLRRGGREYYALDVTNPNNPKLLWKVEPGLDNVAIDRYECQGAVEDHAHGVGLHHSFTTPPDGSSHNHEHSHVREKDHHTRSDGLDDEQSACKAASYKGTGKFSNLAQSWSTPYLARIRTSDSDMREVAIFSGGYDVNQDIEDHAKRGTTDRIGNDVFIVDAKTGEYIWSLQGSGARGALQLQHSIPGGLRLLDMNQDGAVDRMYFADAAANVWRLELPSGPDYSLSSSKLIKFAELGSSEGSEARKFYNEPDVSLLKHGGRSWLAVSVGSGYRAHPANEKISDAFFVMIDGAVHQPLTKNLDGDSSFRTLTTSDLVQVTASGDQAAGSISQGAMTDQTIFDVQGKAGWYLKMPQTGEKVLSNSITYDGKVMFTTLVPNAGSADAVKDLCSAPITQGRFYSMNLLNAEAGSDLDRNGTVADKDLYVTVTANEIPGTPQRVFNEPECKDAECEHIVDIRVGKKSSPVTNYDSVQLENIFWSNPVKSH